MKKNCYSKFILLTCALFVFSGCGSDAQKDNGIIVERASDLGAAVRGESLEEDDVEKIAEPVENIEVEKFTTGEFEGVRLSDEEVKKINPSWGRLKINTFPSGHILVTSSVYQFKPNGVYRIDEIDAATFERAGLFIVYDKNRFYSIDSDLRITEDTNFDRESFVPIQDDFEFDDVHVVKDKNGLYVLRGKNEVIRNIDLPSVRTRTLKYWKDNDITYGTFLSDKHNIWFLPHGDNARLIRGLDGPNIQLYTLKYQVYLSDERSIFRFDAEKEQASKVEGVSLVGLKHIVYNVYLAEDHVYYFDSEEQRLLVYDEIDRDTYEESTFDDGEVAIGDKTCGVHRYSNNEERFVPLCNNN